MKALTMMIRDEGRDRKRSPVHDVGDRRVKNHNEVTEGWIWNWRRGVASGEGFLSVRKDLLANRDFGHSAEKGCWRKEVEEYRSENERRKDEAKNRDVDQASKFCKIETNQQDKRDDHRLGQGFEHMRARSGWKKELRRRKGRREAGATE